MKKIFLVLSIIIGFTACTEKQQKNNEECLPCKNKENMATIKSFEKITKDHKAFQKLTQTASFQKMSNRKDYTLIVDSAFIITYDETNIKSVVIPYDIKNDQTNLKARYILGTYIEDDSYLTEPLIIEKRDKSETIPSSKDNIKILCSEGDLLYNITKNADNSVEINQGGTCGLETMPPGWGCVTYAFTSCASDPGCAIYCTFCNNWCIAAIVTACAVHNAQHHSN